MVASARMRINRALVIALLAAGVACADAADPELVERFRTACARLAAEAEAAGAAAVVGSDGWRFAAAEIAALGRGAPPDAADTDPNAASADRVLAVTDRLSAAAARLRESGIELVVVPVPPKAIVYPDRLAPALDVPIPVRRLDADLQAVYADLRERGVRVVDLTAAFIRDRFHHEGPLYCRGDAHWSGVGCVLAAEIIGAAVRDAGLIATPPDQPYGLGWFTVPVRGNLGPHPPAAPLVEEIRVRGLIAPEDPALAPVAADGDAPVAVVGDTHALVFHGGEPYHARGGGIADQLAFEFRQPVALHADAGSASSADGPEIPPLGARTRVVIRIFAATRLLGGGD